MTSREIVLEQIHHRETRPVPYTLGFEVDVSERLDRHYGSKEWRGTLQNVFVGTGVVDNLKMQPEGRPHFHKDLYGSIWRLDQSPWHQEEPALKEPSFKNYRWPDPKAAFSSPNDVQNAQRFCSENKDKHFINASIGWGLFESCWGIRGFENVLMDIVAEPGFVDELLDRLTEQFLAYVKFTCESLPEVDAIMFGDDWGDQRGVIIGPDRWRKLFKPRYARIYDAVHAAGKRVITHCCGSIVDILPDVIEIGLDVLESCQPEARGMNPYELKKKFGKHLTFWGCLGSQSTVPFGTPDQIRAEVRRLCREMGRGGGFILSPAKWLQPDTPTENAAAVVESFVYQD
jgi:uroporphyrinogen decarboxylase